MTDSTNYLKNQFIGWLIQGTAFDSPPSDLYIALHTGPPGDDATNNEVSATSYQRYNSNATSDWNETATGEFENVSDFVFVESQEDWGSVSHFSLWDGPDGTDNAIAQDALLESRTIESGDSAVFRDGSLSGVFE